MIQSSDNQYNKLIVKKLLTKISLRNNLSHVKSNY